MNIITASRGFIEQCRESIADSERAPAYLQCQRCGSIGWAVIRDWDNRQTMVCAKCGTSRGIIKSTPQSTDTE